jgi:NADH:ubiquinone oxidoreductase subunit C
MKVDLILASLREILPSQTIETRRVPIDETFAVLPPECIRPAVQVLIEQFGVTHLSTITGQDTGNEIQLFYHFWDGEGLTLCTSLSQEDARIATLTGLLPGAAFYEREVGEMLHVTFVGHPDPRKLLLPDDWGGEAPLRKGFSTPSLGEDQGEELREEGTL